MIFVLGIDAATWTVIRPNLDNLPNFKKLTEIGIAYEPVLEETPLSPLIWCGMFCGKKFEEHGHKSFAIDGELVKRNDIKVDFIWDILDREGKDIRVLGVPFVVPPYSFNVDFKPIGFGLPTTPDEWMQELVKIAEKSIELMAQKPDVLIAVYTLLDRVQHFHWGEPVVLDWYMKVDSKLKEILFDTGFLDNPENKLIIISDHGFCSFGDAKVQTLPKETPFGVLKGDHHENAFAITVNLDYEIKQPQDVFHAIRKFA